MGHDFHLAVPDPFDFDRCVGRFRRYGADPVNRVEDGAYLRVIRHEGRLVAYRASPAGNGVTVTVEHTADEEPAAADLRHRFATALDPEPVRRLAERDRVFAAHWRAHRGLRPPLTPDHFEQIVTSITAQQVNLRWATVTRRRLVETYGEAVRRNGRTWWAFPAAARLAAADPAGLHALQFTRARAAAIVGVAAAAAAGDLDHLDDLPDDEVIAALVRLRGVGPWTAHWFLARGLGRPAAVARDDLGVRKAVGAYLGGDGPVPADVVARVTAGWGDAANWAVHLLLESLATG